MLRDNAATLIGQMKEQRAPFTRADCEAIGAPTLLMAGERSPASFHRILTARAALRDPWRTYPQRVARLKVDNPRRSTRALAFLGVMTGARLHPTGRSPFVTAP